MKVVAFNGSYRKKGNTGALIKQVFRPLENVGIECELVNIGGKITRGCTGCMICRENLDKRCTIEEDIVNYCIEKMIESDGIIIGSPTYFATLNAETKALIDRAGFVAKGNGNLLRRKVGAAVVSVRRAGSMNVFQAINNFYLINEMIVPGAVYWNIGVGKKEGDVLDDTEGMKIMENLGENMGWLIKTLASN